MDLDVSRGILAVLGAAIGLLSLYGFIFPEKLTAWVLSAWDRKGTMTLAIGTRLVMGVLCLMAAPATKFPLAIMLLGWLMIVAAGAIPVVGWGRLRLMVDWWRTRPGFLLRSWLFFGVVFGVFLVYAVL
ncbi:MAG: hypothetical protein ACC661_07405 [Verrucomicrobiales bacterium]